MSNILLLCRKITEVNTQLDAIHSGLEERMSKNVRHVMLNRKDLDKLSDLVTKLNNILEDLPLLNNDLNKLLHDKGLLYGLVIACYNDFKTNNRQDATNELEIAMKQLTC